MHILIERTRLLFTPFLLVALVATTAAFFMKDQAGHAAPEDTVVLPIEMIGGDGYTETVQVDVGGATGVDRLYLQLHAAGYHPGTEKYGSRAAKASVRINGGPWQDITDETFTCASPEDAYGCIDGVYHTVRGTLPVDGVRKGVNAITFRYNGTDGIGSGYRVLALDLRSGGASAVRGTRFVKEDPTTWAPPEGYDNPADIEAGEQLWHNAALRESSLRGARMIKAACADCHAADGRDLKYFSFSNQSITARSRFHGLSAKEGRQIAAYIRDIQLRLEDGTPYEAPGRPWNPPYQPGPTLAAPGTAAEGMHPDSADAQFWASGAGLDWVLGKDIETLPYLFPDPQETPGPDGRRTRHEIPERYDYTQQLNMRALPLAIQFPDWNNWLPDIHPMDMPNSNFHGSQAFLRYRDQVLPLLENWDRTKSMKTLGKFDRAQKRMDMGLGGLRRAAKGNDMHALSVDQWMLVKAWEMHHTYHLADKIDDLYEGRRREGATAETNWSYDEARSWIGRTRVVFELAPHLGSSGGIRGAPYMYGSVKKDIAFSHLWYHLQTIINPGADPKSSTQNPVDWRYQRNFSNSTASVYGVNSGIRALASYMKQNEMHRHTLDDTYGWGVQQTHPVNLVRLALNQPNMLGELERDLRAELLSALVGGWLSHIDANFAIEDFPRGNRHDEWEPASSRPTLANLRILRGGITYSSHDDNYYRSLVHLADLGARTDVLHDMAALGSQLWPNPKGPAWMDLVPDAPSEVLPDEPVRATQAVRITAPLEGNVFTSPTTIVVQAELTGETTENVERVEFYADGKKLGERTEAPFEYAWRAKRPGQYALSARLVMADGVDTTSAPVSVALRDAFSSVPRLARQEIQLSQGWNFVSSWVQPEEAAIDEVLKDVLASVVLVKNERGQTFIPAYNINTIGAWDPKEAYMVYVDSSVVVSMKGAATDPATSMELEDGWNLVPYLHERPMPAEKAFASIASDIVIAKDYTGRALIPQHEINGIGDLEPGYGYKVYLRQPATLVYPEMSGEDAPLSGPLLASRTAGAVLEASGPKKGSPSSGVIVVETPNLEDGQRIIARGETSGRVGEGTVREGRAVVIIYGDERATPDIVEGALPDEALTLRLATPADPNGTPLTLTDVRSGLSGAPAEASLRYAPDAFLLATAQKGPSEFALEQNYPNPFKKATTITYSLPEATDVTLEVYDLLGRRVATIVSERQKAGWYEAEFEASSVPSGMYFYRLRAGDRSVSKEMVIVR